MELEMAEVRFEAERKRGPAARMDSNTPLLL